MTFSLGQVAFAIGLECQSDTPVTGWSVDSRTISAGDLFIALRGDNHDGHDHVAAAFAKGTAAAIVEHEIPNAGPAVQLVVPDSLAALQQLAKWARKQFKGAVIAVTGSAGKTTTKDTIAHLLSARFKVTKTSGNLNNHIGLPLSILRLDASADVAVLELGMNHAGEIRDLSAISMHNIAVVTNVGYAHVEFFDSIDGIAAAKRELVDALGPDGIAVLNADDTRVARFAETHNGRSILYGIDSADAEVRAAGLAMRFDGSSFNVDGAQFETSVSGRHNVLNILAAIAAGRALGAQPAELIAAARTLEPPKMRGQRVIHDGVLVIDDCYNSNPDAALAMIDFLAAARNWQSTAEPSSGRAIAVLGEMRELGSWSQRLHEQVGRHAAARGIDFVIGVKGDARFTAEGARASGLPADHTLFAAEPEQGGELAKSLARAGDVVLFKGSRGTKMELALGRFTA